MDERRQEEMTQILNAAQSGDREAASSAFAIIYEELRRLAASRMQKEGAGHTLQPTALAHEAWLRLAGQEGGWQNRAHFFGSAAEAMRRILVDHARKKQSLKRGAGVDHEELDEENFVLVAPPEELLAIHDALDEFALEDPTAAELVKLRYFVGMTMDEAAETLGLSTRSAERTWTYARVWLKRAIRDSGER